MRLSDMIRQTEARFDILNIERRHDTILRYILNLGVRCEGADHIVVEVSCDNPISPSTARARTAMVTNLRNR